MDRQWFVMRTYVQFNPGTWAVILQTRVGWWGMCRVPDAIYLDLGLIRVSRRGKWTPLFTEPHPLGPIQWWRQRCP